MGAWRRGRVAACAAILCFATRSWASTVVEPIARLSVEGGYDSNVLDNGSGGDRTARISPDVGLRARDHLWSLLGAYGGDFVYYETRRPGGIWNHRGTLSLKSDPTPRLALDGALRGAYAYDPLGLAQAGVFRTGNQSALILDGRFRGEWRATRRVDVAAAVKEKTVVFDDHTGGAMHAPELEMLWHKSERFQLGGGYRLGVFQSFETTRDETSLSHGLRAHARYLISRGFALDASAGPAYWTGSDGSAFIPEARVELLGASREWDVRVSAGHGLDIGYTARPGLVNSFEFGGERRFAHRFFLRAEGGVWQSGVVPSGSGATTGYAVAAEAGALVAQHVRMSVTGTQLGRMDEPSSEIDRTTVGLRFVWELPTR